MAVALDNGRQPVRRDCGQCVLAVRRQRPEARLALRLAAAVKVEDQRPVEGSDLINTFTTGRRPGSNRFTRTVRWCLNRSRRATEDDRMRTGHALEAELR